MADVPPIRGSVYTGENSPTENAKKEAEKLQGTGKVADTIAALEARNTKPEGPQTQEAPKKEPSLVERFESGALKEEMDAIATELKSAGVESRAESAPEGPAPASASQSQDQGQGRG